MEKSAKKGYKRLQRLSARARARRQACRYRDQITVNQLARQELWTLLQIAAIEDESFSVESRCLILLSLADLLFHIREFVLARSVLERVETRLKAELAEHPLDVMVWQTFSSLLGAYIEYNLLDSANACGQALLTHLHKHKDREFNEDEDKLMQAYEDSQSFVVVDEGSDVGLEPVVPAMELNALQKEWCKSLYWQWSAHKYTEFVERDLAQLIERRHQRQELEKATETMLGFLENGPPGA